MSNPLVYLDVGILCGDHLGRIVIELFAHTTPRTAESFRVVCTGKISRRATYKDTCFFHIVNSVCFGGDMKTGRRELEPIYGLNPKAENFIRKHDGPGTVSMLNVTGPEFFISTKKLPHCDGKFLVVGKVVEGLGVVEEITNLGSQFGYPVIFVMVTGSGELKETNIPATQRISTKDFEQVASTSNNELSKSLKEVMNVSKQLVNLDPEGVVVPQDENELVAAAESFRRSLNVLSDLKAEVCSLEKRHRELLSKTETKISTVKNKRIFLETIPSLSYEEHKNIKNVCL